MDSTYQTNLNEDEEIMELEARGNTFQEIALRMSIDFWLRVREQTPGPVLRPYHIVETAGQFYEFLLHPTKEGKPT